MGTETLRIGSQAPEFRDLPGVDGKLYSLSDFSGKAILVVAFTCNHCPYVQAYEDRMISFQKQYGLKGVQLVAINANETVHYPEDSFDEMVKRATKKRFIFPYLRDEKQIVATAYGATHTPEFFVFDASRTLRYHGAMDDNWRDPASVRSLYLTQAIDATLEAREVPIAETYSVGCTIKWA